MFVCGRCGVDWAGLPAAFSLDRMPVCLKCIMELPNRPAGLHVTIGADLVDMLLRAVDLDRFRDMLDAGTKAGAAAWSEGEAAAWERMFDAGTDGVPPGPEK